MLESSSDTRHPSLLVLRLRQSLICLGPVLITISLGLAEGYSAILLPQLEEESDWNIDTNLSSWIASIATLPMCVGCLLGGWLMEMIGRKMLHMLTCLPNLIGWLLIAFCGRSIAMLLAGRFLTGICIGILSPVLTIYVAEISDPVFRGFLSPTVILALNLGISIAHVMGTFVKWKLVALSACIYPIACFVLLLFMPESPTYLIKKGKIDEAKIGFIWCRGNSKESTIELEFLISRQQQGTNSPKKTLMQHLEIFRNPTFYKPLLILLFFLSAMQCSGINPIAFYTVTILKEVLRNSTFNPYTSMLIMDGVRMIASILSCFGLQYLSRRLLMIISCSGSLISLLILSVYLFITHNYDLLNDSDLSLIAVISLVGYVLFSNLGLLPLPYAMSGELFASSSRGLGSGIASFCNMLQFFILIKITPWLFKVLPTEAVFLLFGVCCLVGMIVLIIVLPETRNKPLHEIENYFNGNKRSNSIYK
ncbi:unnamed protein product [Ceutorhynchus assimilis]|uniref:Major facilitator superfamily (MFS) profile domain-containing protein n=1 Tax=Ceutorhynchus assimilis TaxID=467358 RepID=A0A9N9MF29_9CUCU|nr:unnamed protein product [Ceutorhynchus assimilis]